MVDEILEPEKEHSNEIKYVLLGAGQWLRTVSILVWGRW